MKKIFTDLKLAFIFVAFFSFIMNLLMLVAPLYMIQVYDRVITSRSIETLIYLTIMSVVALLVFAILFLIRSGVLNSVAKWIDREFSSKALEISFDTHLLGNNYGGQSLTDIGLIKQFVTGPGIQTFFDAPWTPIFLFVIFMLHPYLGIFATIGGAVLLTLAILNEYTTRENTKNASKISMFAQRKVDGAIRNADVLHAMGMFTGFTTGWRELYDQSGNLQAKATYQSSVLLSIIKFVRLSMQLGILGIGAYLVINGELTSGGMIAGSILLGRALAPVEQAVGSWKQWILARQAYQRLDAHFSSPEARPCDFELPPPNGLVQIEGLTYAYPRAQKPAIYQVSANVQPAESVAIIGPTASGKSTLTRLIVGALHPNSGAVRMDGAELHKFKRSIVGKYIGYLPQDIELFSGSIKENIARLEEVDDKAVLEASQLAGVHELILRLPQGYETQIGESGESLSGGQRQRIALARALYGKPKLLVLDEPNSNLDAEGEIALETALKSAKSWGATVFIVAHRPSILRDVDKVMVMQNGRLAKFGNRSEVFEELKVDASVIGKQNT